ncbi:MAG: ester cyclase [archaeon]
MTERDSTVETNEEIVRRIPTEIFDDGNVDLVDELFAEDFVGHVPPVPGELHGPEGFEGLVRAFRTGFPDLNHPDIHLVGDGDTVVARLTGTGTHGGEFLGIEPTGERMETTAMEMYRLDDGEITEAWLNVDMLGLLQQLGVVQEL